METSTDIAKEQDASYCAQVLDALLAKANLVAFAGEQVAFLVAPTLLGTPSVGWEQRIAIGAAHGVCYLIARASEYRNRSQFEKLGVIYGRTVKQEQS